MFDRIESIQAFQKYVAYLNNYLNDAPPSVRATLIDDECEYLDQQCLRTVEYAENDLHSRLYLLYLNRQYLQFQDKTFQKIDHEENLSSASQALIEDKKNVDEKISNTYSSLYQKVKSAFLKDYSSPAKLEDIDLEYKKILTRLYWHTFLKELKSYLISAKDKTSFTPIDTDLIINASWTRFFRNLISREAILFLDTHIIVQKYANLSDTFHEERSAIGEILEDSFKHSIEPHLIYSRALGFQLEVRLEPQATYWTVNSGDIKKSDDKEGYEVTLRPDHIIHQGKLITLVFEPNNRNTIYQTTYLTFASSELTIKEIDGKPTVTLRLKSNAIRKMDLSTTDFIIQTHLVNQANKDIIKDAFADFIDSHKVLADDVETALQTDTHDRLTYLGVPCRKVGKNLVRDYEHTKDKQFDEFSTVEKKRLEHLDAPRFIHKNIDDTKNHLSRYYDGTAHKYLDMTSYYDPNSPFQIHPIDFLNKQLDHLAAFKAQFNGTLTSDKKPLSITDKIEVKPFRTPFDPQLSEQIKCIKGLIQEQLQEKFSPAVVSNVKAREKALLTLERYLKKRQADNHALQQAFLNLIQSLEAHAQTDDEKTQLSSLITSETFELGITTYREHIDTQLHSIKKESEKGPFYAQNAILKRLDPLMLTIDGHLDTTIRTALLIVDEIESHNPTWRERSLLDNIRHFLLYPIRAILKHSGLFTDNSFWFSLTERRLMTLKQGLHDYAKARPKNPYSFFKPKSDIPTPISQPMIKASSDLPPTDETRKITTQTTPSLVTEKAVDKHSKIKKELSSILSRKLARNNPYALAIKALSSPDGILLPSTTLDDLEAVESYQRQKLLQC